MTEVEPQQQLRFLSNIQRLLSEGQFTATYKYALLLAIADICVEDGEDNGAPFIIHTNKIAEKFIAYYWPHTRPYEGVVLRQNTGNTAAVISALTYFAERNGQVLGAPIDLDQFLFGTERATLAIYLPILNEVQEARCLYCRREVAPGTAHIDHFIPWSRYPIDLGHNFVLAHAGCNSAKADHLAAREHIVRWVERNRTAAAFLQEQFDQGLIVHSAQRSERIARWAYSQAAATRALAWVRHRDFQPIDESCVHLLA